MESNWLTWIKQIHALAGSGLHYGEAEFDLERYAEISNLAEQLMAKIGDGEVPAVQSLLADHGQGYSTPKVEVRGAVIRNNQILLVQERSDKKWTLPGGFADVGISPAENTVKEIREEANIQVQTDRLYAIRHKARHGYDADLRDFYKLMFLCSAEPDQQPVAGMETMDADFFALSQLPPLSTGRILAQDIELAFTAAADPNFRPVFD